MTELTEIDDFVKLNGIQDHRHLTPIITGWGGKVNSDIEVLGDGRQKNMKPKICPSLFRMAITWQGEVLPCCNNVHGENTFGNINDLSFGDIVWGSKMWKQKAECSFDICNNCLEGDDIYN